MPLSGRFTGSICFKAQRTSLDPDSKKLNTTRLDQLEHIKAAMKNLAKIRASLEDMEKGRKSSPPKGDNPPPPPAAGAKRYSQGEAPPAPKKRKPGPTYCSWILTGLVL